MICQFVGGPGYMTYYRHAFVERHSRAALYAYFCGVEVTSVVPIVLGGQLYLTRPRDIQNVGANVLAKMFRAWCWTTGTWSSTSHQRGVHDVGATYADGIRVQFRQNAGEVETPKGRFPERYAQHAFDSCVGKEVPLKLEDQQVGMATLIAAKVIEDGRAVLLTYEIPPRLIAAAEEFLVDRLNWAGGGSFQVIVSRWLIHNAEQVEHGQVATDEQHGAMALANAYLRYRQTVSPARGDDQGAKEEVGQENSGSLGDCPRCGSVITEAKAHVEKVETEPSGGGLFRQFVPGAMELVLSPCKCRFWGSEAAVLGAELRHRQVGRVTTRDTPEGQV